MTAVRLSRWIFLLTALIASIAWSWIAIDHLLDYSISQQLRESQYGPTSQPVSEHMLTLEATQKHWGRQTMFGIACSILFLLAVMMNWVLDGRPRRRTLEK